MNKPIKYTCSKCGSKTCTAGEIWTTGSLFTRIFDIQNKRFTSVTCTECKFTEFYKISLKRLGEVLIIPEKADMLH